MGRQLCNHNRKTKQSGPKLVSGESDANHRVFQSGAWFNGGQDQKQSGSTGGRNIRFILRERLCLHDNFERLARCEELAEKKGCTVSQIALAWMFRQDLNIYVLVSTTRAFRLEENLRAFTVNLSEEENRYLNAGRKAAGFMSK